MGFHSVFTRWNYHWQLSVVSAFSIAVILPFLMEVKSSIIKDASFAAISKLVATFEMLKEQ